MATGLLYRPACSGPLAQSRRTTLRMLPLPTYRSAPTAVKRAVSTHPRLRPAGTSSASPVTRAGPSRLRNRKGNVHGVGLLDCARGGRSDRRPLCRTGVLHSAEAANGATAAADLLAARNRFLATAPARVPDNSLKGVPPTPTSEQPRERAMLATESPDIGRRSREGSSRRIAAPSDNRPTDLRSGIGRDAAREVARARVD